ncbi:MAG TPA: Clp protease N-terminal domain-containing protein [Streptosporangiaceae bacterium]
MFERFTGTARQIVVQAQHHARRFGHNYIGPEHLFLALVAADDPTSALLRDLGLTPDRTEAEFIRLTRSKPSGPPGSKAPFPAPAGSPASPLAALDAEALAAIGIDLEEVRTRIEATFGPGALSRAVPHGHPSRPPLHRWLLHRGQRGPGRAGQDTRPAVVRGHIPFTPRAKKVLELSLREAVGLGDNYIGPEHVTLALIRIKDGVVPHLLATLEVTPDTIRAALLDQRRQAS